MRILEVLRRKPAALATLLLGGTLLWAARQPGAPLRPSGFNFFTRQQDVELGREAAQQIIKQNEIVHDQILQDYLKKIGARLAATPEARESRFSFTFTVLNKQRVNAFAVPGGPMFVNTGLFRAVDNEAQLAGAM